MDNHGISSSARRIGNKLVRRFPSPERRTPLIGVDDEVEEFPLRTVVTSEDGRVSFSGNLVLEDHLIAIEQICLQAQQVASHLYHHRNQHVALQDLNFYGFNVCETPMVGETLALDYKGPEVLAILHGFLQKLNCEAVGSEVVPAVLKKVNSSIMEILTERQAKRFSEKFKSAVLGDPSYKLITVAALYMKDVDPGVKFARTCDAAAAKKLVPAGYGRSQYIAIRCDDQVDPYVGPESVASLIRFVCKTFDISLKRLPTLTPNGITDANCGAEDLGDEGL